MAENFSIRKKYSEISGFLGGTPHFRYTRIFNRLFENNEKKKFLKKTLIIKNVPKKIPLKTKNHPKIFIH